VKLGGMYHKPQPASTTAALTIPSLGLPLPTGATPSMADFFTFSFANPILSNTPPSPICSPDKPSKRKRNNGREARQTNASSKGSWVMDRPKGGWARTQLRKLACLLACI